MVMHVTNTKKKLAAIITILNINDALRYYVTTSRIERSSNDFSLSSNDVYKTRGDGCHTYFVKILTVL